LKLKKEIGDGGSNYLFVIQQSPCWKLVMEEAKLQIFIYDSNYNLDQGKFDKIAIIIICNNCDLIG
jgi:hypothetical protein